MSDWPMPPHDGPGDEDFRTPDECADLLLDVKPVPPPDVWEFYRRHGRWPEDGEA